MTTRRRWLAGTLGLGLASCGLRSPGGESKSNDDHSEPPTEAALARAKAAGLTDFRTARTDHYIALGDAPQAFLRDALGLCEKLAATYQKHFQAKGFNTPFPPQKMTAVVLAGPQSYAAYKGDPVGENEGGHYDIENDQLVMFDFQGGNNPDARRLNTVTLVHEALHQLTFSTGLLSRKANVPVAVSEGLSTYGELWTLGRPEIGQPNSYRLRVLSSRGAKWIPVERLLSRDEDFDDTETEQSAYAGAWVFIHALLKDRAKIPMLRAYLDLIRTRTDDAHRAEDAAKAFGDLAKLDRELRRAARV